MVPITDISGERDAACETAVIFVTLLDYDAQKTARSILKLKLSLCLSRTPKDI
jgi:hypothetical protein